MRVVRRGYIYLVSFVSVQSIAWATIALLRNLLAPDEYTSVESTAFQIAVVIVGLPLFLAHWLWAQRLAGRELAERRAILRRLYLYGAMASFLAPFIANTYELFDTLMQMIFGLNASAWRSGLSQAGIVIHNLVAMFVMALLWFYHQRVEAQDGQTAPVTGHAATVRRLYVLGFSASGLTLTVLAVISLLLRLMLHLGGKEIAGGAAGFTEEVARLAVGLPLWLAFWSWAQRLFAKPDQEERTSILRKLYLYVVVFISVIATLTAATHVVAGTLRRVLAISSPGSGSDIREALAIIVGAAVAWAYHAYVLRRDAALTGAQPTQAWVQQLYRYLVAGIGLAAFLVGLSGNVSILIRLLAGVSFVSGIAHEVTWFSAILIVGLPVWVLPWRQVQIAAAAPGPSGDEETRSTIRKIYLYFYLFVAAMTVLCSAVYVVYRLVSLALGESGSGNLLADLGQAIAYSLIAVGLWLYHGSILRADGQRARQVQAQRLASLHIAVVDVDDGSLGHALIDELERELAGANLRPLGLTAEASAALGTNPEPANVAAVMAESDVIVGPWTIAVASAAGGTVSTKIAQAVAASPAHKLLIPLHKDGWDWVGAGDLSSKTIVRQTVQAVRQIAIGEKPKRARLLSAGLTIAIIVVILFVLLIVLGPALVYVFY